MPKVEGQGYRAQGLRHTANKAVIIEGMVQRRFRPESDATQTNPVNPVGPCPFLLQAKHHVPFTVHLSI